MREREKEREIQAKKTLPRKDDKFRVRELMKKRTHYRNHDLEPLCQRPKELKNRV